MEKQFLMGNDGLLRRERSTANESTYVSPRLYKALVGTAIERAFVFFGATLGIDTGRRNYDSLAVEYEAAHAEALALGLFRSGGVREKDHLTFWCLARVFEPEVYVESGVFIGSSLHAFIGAPTLKRTIGIDPNLSNLKVPKERIPGAELIDDRDFSQLEMDFTGLRALAYFDDHIDTASRIEQSARMGLRYLMFDDSTGLEGICQRLYPAVPTIPMIMNWNLLRAGDTISWTFTRPGAASRGYGIKAALLRSPKDGDEKTRITMFVTDEIIAQCRAARGSIKKVEKLLDVGEFIPQMWPEKQVDTSKYLVELT